MNMILDYDLSFTPEIIQRFAEIGNRVIYVFDFWHQHEPEPGRYDFDEIVRYAEVCRSEGIKMLLQTPIGSPLWMDESFYLVNEFGQNSRFSELCYSEVSQSTDILGSRIPSYWHREAEEHTVNYIKVLRSIVEPLGVSCISNIGAIGEYMFPAIFWIDVKRTASPWWFDAEARSLWKDRDPVEWFREERRKIIARRLSCYQEQWTQFVPYYDSWDNWQLGNNEISRELEVYSPQLKTILFTVFDFDYCFLGMAEQQAQCFPTWGGAEGCANVVVNTKRALDMGLKGTLCRLIDPGADEPTVPDWKYQALKTANKLFTEDGDKEML